jgi:hypothetical protein
MSYICHSGGCPGADMEWENEGNKYGVKTIAYSFGGHKQEGQNREILSAEQLNEGFEHVLIANKAMKRYPQGQARYIQNLLARNWFQVKNAESIFAVGKFLDKKKVSGGTGWAVQMAIDNQKPTFVFDQEGNKWNKFNYALGEFEVIDYIPKLTENFAGVGTREINDKGIVAIEKILEYNFS